MFWLAYVFTVIVGGAFALVMRILKKVTRHTTLREMRGAKSSLRS